MERACRHRVMSAPRTPVHAAMLGYTLPATQTQSEALSSRSSHVLTAVGAVDGAVLGRLVGKVVGLAVDMRLGWELGRLLGAAVGRAVGPVVGA